MAWYYRSAIWPLRAPAPAVVPAQTAPAAPTLPPTLVVVPFEPPAGDAARSYLAAGLSFDLITRLARKPGVRVLARAAVRDGDRNLAAVVAGQVGASVAATGKVSGDIGALRVDVTLLRAGTGERIWSGAFSQGPAGVFALQDQVVDAVLGQLAPVAAKASPGRRGRSADAQAYDLYLRGRDAAERRDRARAAEFYEQALARDAALVEAHAALAEALYLEAFYGGAGIDPGTGRRAAEAANRAVATDADFPPAQLARGLTAPTLAEALDALVLAVTLDPSYAEAWHQIGDQIIESDPERALVFYRESLRLDPGLDASHRDIASAQQLAGRPDEARRAIAAGRAARPDRPWWTQLEARFALEQSAWDEARKLLAGQAATESVPAVWLAGVVSPLAITGRTKEAIQSVSKLVERYPRSCDGRAISLGLHLKGGDRRDYDKARSGLNTLVVAGLAASAAAEARVCGAVAAAALGDVPRTARLITAIADDEPSLRLWLREATFSVNLAFRHRWYPWNRVASRSEVRSAIEKIDDKIARFRRVIAGRLDSLQARVAAAQSTPAGGPILSPRPSEARQ